MNKTLRCLIAILMAIALVFAMSAAVLADDEEEDEEEEQESSSASWTNTITNPEAGSQNVIQNVNVNVEVEVENEGDSGNGSSSADVNAATGAVQNPETLLKYCEITGNAITSHDWVYLYSESSIHSKILETLKTREEPVEIIGRAENSKHQIWYKVKTASGKIGYIQDKYLLYKNADSLCTSDTLQVSGTGTAEQTPCQAAMKDGNCQKAEGNCQNKCGNCQNVLPAGVTVEVTYVPEVVYVPQITYVPKLIYVTPEPTPTPSPAPTQTPAP